MVGERVILGGGVWIFIYIIFLNFVGVCSQTIILLAFVGF